jgi:hypothetical protein
MAPLGTTTFGPPPGEKAEAEVRAGVREGLLVWKCAREYDYASARGFGVLRAGVRERSGFCICVCARQSEF